MEDAVLQLLSGCGISITDDGHVIEQEIPRDPLVAPGLYESLQHCIALLKVGLSSSTMTSLQSNAPDNQRWPLINLLRQVLKQYGFRMVPVRHSCGASKAGKKLYRRCFRISKYRSGGPMIKEDQESLS